MSDQSGARREDMLKELASAYDAFVELKGNLEEGNKVGYVAVVQLSGCFIRRQYSFIFIFSKSVHVTVIL